MNFDLNNLLDYTEWERQQWHEWFRRHGDQVLKITVGTNGDKRFEAVGDTIRHIFSAEKRYIDRLSGRTLTDPAAIPWQSAEALFQFGRQSRQDLQEFVATFPAEKWDFPEEYQIMNSFLTATPRKIVVHILMHEIRHWAQIATLLRLNGFKVDFHDFLFSPVLGGEFRREQDKASAA